MLLVGTLKLEDTDQAVSAEQAATLLPLWQAYRSLSTSQTAAEAEVDALLNQIQSTMTSDQVDAINAMNLTITDMMDLMQSMGVGMGPREHQTRKAHPDLTFQLVDFDGGNPPSGDIQMGSGEPPGGSSEWHDQELPIQEVGVMHGGVTRW